MDWTLRTCRAALLALLLGAGDALVRVSPPRGLMRLSLLTELSLPPPEPATFIVERGTITPPTSAAATAALAPEEATAPSWLRQFQESLRVTAERQLKESEAIEKQRVLFETELAEKRAQFERDLEVERKQFELDLKKEKELREQKEDTTSDIKYGVSLGVTLTLFALDQVLKKKDADSSAKKSKRGKDSFLD